MPSTNRKRKQARKAAEEKGKAGRPTRLTQAMIDRMCTAIRSGAYIETAAAYCGIAKQTFYNWLKKGRDDSEHKRDTIARTLTETVDRAMAEAEMLDLTTITMFAKGHEVVKETTLRVVNAQGVVLEERNTTETRIRREWQAAAWRLERRNPQRWGRRLAIAGEGGEPMGVKLYLPRKKPLDDEDAA